MSTRTSVRPTCSLCSARVVWLRDPRSRYVAVDPYPVPGGRYAVDYGLGTVSPVPEGTSDPSLADERARPRFHNLHRDGCRNVTYRRSIPSPRRDFCGRRLWRPPTLVVCTAPAGHDGECP